jgi:hypothetical protein
VSRLARQGEPSTVRALEFAPANASKPSLNGLTALASPRRSIAAGVRGLAFAQANASKPPLTVGLLRHVSLCVPGGFGRKIRDFRAPGATAVCEEQH